MARKKKGPEEDADALGEELLELHAEVEPEQVEATIARDVARAREALGDGRVVEALFAAAWALWLEPGRPELQALLDEVLDAGDARKVELPPRGAAPEPLFGAVLAWAAWRDGEREDALRHLDEAALEDPDLPFAAAWLPRWLDDDEALRALGAELALERLAPLAREAADSGDGPDPAPLALAERAERALGLDRVGDAATADVLTDALAAAGKHDDAVKLARAGLEARNDLAATKALAVALRRAGKRDEAVTRYLEAHALDDDDLGCLLDAADLRLDQGRWQDALDLYERVLARERHPWAVPSAHFCRWRLGDAASLHALRVCAEREEEQAPDLAALMSKPPQQAVADLMALFAPKHDPGLERERAEMLLDCFGARPA